MTAVPTQGDEPTTVPTTMWWRAPSCPGQLDATALLPGSKSQTNRALIIGALGRRPLAIHDALASRDTVLAAEGLQQFGVSFASSQRQTLLVSPPDSLVGRGLIDCGLAGTVMRFLPAVAAFAHGAVTFDGDTAARGRPLRPLLDALETLGADVKYFGEPGFLPFKITGSATSGTSDVGLPGVGLEADPMERPAGNSPQKSVELDSSDSSQYLSALLLAACLAPEPFVINLAGAVPSAPHVQMTIRMLTDQGVPVDQVSSDTYRVGGTRPDGRAINIEPDLSNAGPFLAAALICGGTVRVPGWPHDTTQAGDRWRQLLPLFGAEVSLRSDGLRVTGTPERRWAGADLDLSDVGELTPTVAALCVLADSPSRLRGISHLRGHETDRLLALATEIRRCGAGADILSDGLLIKPGKLRPAQFESYDDHRMATFGALLGLAIPGCAVSNIETTAKTIPDFAKRWEALLAGASSPPFPELFAAINIDASDVSATAEGASS